MPYTVDVNNVESPSLEREVLQLAEEIRAIKTKLLASNSDYEAALLLELQSYEDALAPALASLDLFIDTNLPDLESAINAHAAIPNAHNMDKVKVGLDKLNNLSYVEGYPAPAGTPTGSYVKLSALAELRNNINANLVGITNPLNPLSTRLDAIDKDPPFKSVGFVSFSSTPNPAPTPYGALSSDNLYILSTDSSRMFVSAATRYGYFGYGRVNFTMWTVSKVGTSSFASVVVINFDKVYLGRNFPVSVYYPAQGQYTDKFFGCSLTLYSDGSMLLNLVSDVNSSGGAMYFDFSRGGRAFNFQPRYGW